MIDSNQRIILVIFFSIILLGGIGFFLINNNLDKPIACTLEAKICPDGSAVGRTWPNCGFADCPTTTPPTTGGGGGILPYNSGIRGVVVAGPTCPVERDPPDPNCADKPLATLVAIFRASDLVHAVVLAQSNKNGAFEASLPPGDYVVGAGESMLPRCSQTSATVGPDAYTMVVVQCDTGIR